MSKTILSICIMIMSFSLYGQINVSVGWGQDSIDLGGKVDLMLFVKGSQDAEVLSISDGFLDSLISGFQTVKLREADSTKSNEYAYADVEIIDYGGFKIIEDDDEFSKSEMNWEASTVGGELLFTNRFKLRIWDPGQIIATTPQVLYSFQGQENINDQKFQAALFVRPPIDLEAMEQDSFDISPIKTIIKEPVQWSDYRPYVLGLLGLAALFIGYLLYQKYQARSEELPKEVIEVIIPAHKIALDKLHDLDEKKLWQSDIKGYQSELTYIVREYLENRYDIPALESTTDEIVADIKKKDLDATLIGEMKNILQVADLVKFAKSKPSLNIHQEFMDKAFDFVRKTQKKVELSPVKNEE